MFESVFQSFTETADPSQGAARVAALREELQRRGLDGFVVPRADEHQNEYVPKGAERLAWLTGFTGSAGAAVVLPDRAAIFVDGRYTIQVREQVDTGAFAPQSLIDRPPDAWLADAVTAGQRIGLQEREAGDCLPGGPRQHGRRKIDGHDGQLRAQAPVQRRPQLGAAGHQVYYPHGAGGRPAQGGHQATAPAAQLPAR